MPKSHNDLTLLGNNQEHVILSGLTHQGSGVFTCSINVQSSGFSCQMAFNFDNDEYFLAKLRAVLKTHSADAELLDLQCDNYLKIQALDKHTVLVSGLILQEQPFSQSLEFAFPTSYDMLERFVEEFARMVQTHT